MPAREFIRPAPELGHVNFMVDTYIANAPIEDLRALTRDLLAMSKPEFAGSFTESARRILSRNAASVRSLTAADFLDVRGEMSTTFSTVLGRIRSCFGVGMGFESLEMLAPLVRVIGDSTWDNGSALEKAVVIVDTDITQAVQSCKEQIEYRGVADLEHARGIVANLRSAVVEANDRAEELGVEPPFEKAFLSIRFWKL